MKKIAVLGSYFGYWELLVIIEAFDIENAMDRLLQTATERQKQRIAKASRLKFEILGEVPNE